MFLLISWANYTVYTLIILAIYYPALLIIYKKMLFHSLQYKSSDHNTFNNINKSVADGTTSETRLVSPNKEASNHNSLIHDLVNEIQAYTAAVGEDEEKEIILSGIRKILKKYPTLEETHLQESIEELISVSCENNCSVYLSESEIRGLWQQQAG